MAHTARAILLKAELEQVRKNIRRMEKEVEKINSKRMKAYKCAYELREEMGVVSCLLFISRAIYFMNEQVLLIEGIPS